MWCPKAQARCHRIGQNKMVKVYRLITRNSYEREMFDRASLKLGLDRAVLQSMNSQQQQANGVSFSLLYEYMCVDGFMCVYIHMYNIHMHALYVYVLDQFAMDILDPQNSDSHLWANYRITSTCPRSQTPRP